MAITSNELSIPEVLLAPSARRQVATYIDVNPTPSAGKSDLLFDGAAVFVGIRNLLLCPPGGRSRIFNPEFFSGVYHLLQEPFDEQTAAALRLAVIQGIQRWETRVTLNPSACNVVADENEGGYRVSLSLVINGNAVAGEFLLPANT